MELAALALVGWLVWSRYLHHQEVKLLLERGGDWRALVAARERWQARWGIIIGACILLVGAGLAVTGAVIRMPDQDRLSAYVIGACLGAIGSLIAGAHLVWQRRAAVRTGSGAAG